MRELNKRIEEFSEELYVDLSPVSLPEEVKADIYARIEERLHQVIMDMVSPKLGPQGSGAIKDALDHEDYPGLADLLARHDKLTKEVQDRIEEELKNLKATISQEQQHAGQAEPGTP